jgi:glycosyltransferase involved in cell wall biosynthesis
MKKHTKHSLPFVSIVMPVFNAGMYLRQSIDSILAQTYSHFEFIIVDDASTDNSLEILKEYAKKDKRITVLTNKKNLGVSMTVKKAIKKAKGTYLARMDADDISYPERLEKQVAYLSTHPHTVAVGTQCSVIDKRGKEVGEKKFPLHHNEIYKYISILIPVQQPSLMIAKNRLPKTFEYYVDGMNTAEEVELIFKLFKYGNVENLPEKLLRYRLHGENTSLKDIKKTFLLTLLSRIKAITVHGYKPPVKGIVATIIQTALVLLLPTSVTLFIYTTIKHMVKHPWISAFSNRQLLRFNPA